MKAPARNGLETAWLDTYTVLLFQFTSNGITRPPRPYLLFGACSLPIYHARRAMPNTLIREIKSPPRVASPLMRGDVVFAIPEYHVRISVWPQEREREREREKRRCRARTPQLARAHRCPRLHSDRLLASRRSLYITYDTYRNTYILRIDSLSYRQMAPGRADKLRGIPVRT